MQFDRFRDDDSAVSPVIGVILMVAITVILAAVIASFVLGLSPGTSTTPTASFSAETGTFDNGDAALNITMDQGQSIQASNLEVTGYSNTGTDGRYINSSGAVNTTTVPSEITAGQKIAVPISSQNNYDVSVVYNGSSTSSTLDEFEA